MRFAGWSRLEGTNLDIELIVKRVMYTMFSSPHAGLSQQTGIELSGDKATKSTKL